MNSVCFSTIDNISKLVIRSNFTLVFFKAACCAERCFAGLSLFISRQIFPKFSNACTNYNVSF